jgi:DMSO/TMAO reductase YedYZ molybdopterin-dependent catalytic subunit
MNDDVHDPLRPHRHDPNEVVPSGDGAFVLESPDGNERSIDVPFLRTFPATTLTGCFIVSTGHGASGPFSFTGVRVIDLVRNCGSPQSRWREVEVYSADGFGNRIDRAELSLDDVLFPPLLAYERDGLPLSRAEGLVRLIVPSERHDALRQVKWVARVRVC